MAVPKEVEQELTLLRGFRDLVGERWGYWLGRRVTQQEMNEKTKDERAKVREIRKEINEHIEEYITNSDIETYKAKVSELAEAKKVVAKVSKPFREKISPLVKAVRYLDNVAIPDALKELGTPVQPRFSLSKWINDAIKKK